jgi:hypothetical protein
MNPSRGVLRTVAFSGLGSAAWGTVFGPGDGAFFAAGDGDRTAVETVRLSAGDSEGVHAGDWRLEGDHAALIIAPAGDVVTVQTPDEELGGVAQLCRVSGRVELGGSEHEIESPGLRTWCGQPLDLDRFQSIRAVSTWFGSGEGFVLTALRPRKARAHDADLMTAAVLGPEHSAPVADPRLSTTYSAEGWPMRAGLELWLGEDDREQYPRRASGEATGPHALGAAGELELRAERFRWHSRGQEGTGVYLLAQRP